ncbi:hypothetical protein PH210_16985 [Paenibacillus sp. BSR1-1]|uniref:hypothetical protein n=1 Tax=Paenibacillus sp. BSR1-1 TaxID=3020845 RepID=UPI0025AEE4A8|nr:hypothetical protein [Paenibacillus sp. BSR1-1]MDN3017892.1 hypothetical protein [Paenibacillus sp. BSR1-1]
MEKKLDRMEEMLSSIISIVGNINQQLQEMKIEQQVMKKEQHKMKNDQQGMRKELAAMDSKNEAKITEILNIVTDIRAEQEHIWEKSARNERELAKLKFHLQL